MDNPALSAVLILVSDFVRWIAVHFWGELKVNIKTIDGIFNTNLDWGAGVVGVIYDSYDVEITLSKPSYQLVA